MRTVTYCDTVIRMTSIVLSRAFGPSGYRVASISRLVARSVHP